MKAMKKLFLPSLLALCTLLAASAARAGVADSAVRKPIHGIDVVILKTGVKDVVTIKGTLPAGDSRSPDTNVALADLTAGMLDKGTTKQDKFTLAQKLGDVGATITFGTNASALNVNAKCLKQDLPMVLELIAEQLRQPAFSAEEFAKLKRHVTGLTRRSMEDTDFRAATNFVRAVYPVGHPNREASPEEYLAAVEKTTLEEVKAFHAQYYGPAAMRLVVVGDIEPAVVKAGLGQVFAGWTGGSAQPRPARAGSVDAPRDQDVFMADKTTVSILWGQATQLRYGDPDALALRVGTAILGSGFTGRLMANVRDKEGLTYGIGSFIAADTFTDGDWRIQAYFAPELLDKGIASTRRQLTAWHKDGVTPAELTSAKGKFVGSFKLGLATTDGMASTVLNTVNRDLPLTFIDQFGATINSFTLDQVNGAIKKHLDPEKMVLIKAGTIPGAINK
jgi:zinc protease